MSKVRAMKHHHKQKKSSNMPRNLLIAGMSLLLAGLLMWLALRPSTPTTTTAAPPSNGVEVGLPAPAFNLKSLDGEQVALSDHLGEVVVVNFWATWCPPCRAEMPGIEQVYQAYQADGVVVLAINGQEEPALVKSFIDENGFTFPVLLDGNAEALRAYNARSFPMTVIVDRDGVVQYKQVGPVTPAQLEALLEPLL
ncbi:MAG TPA: TlpA family protein disulfide reductase [Chloroflexi bacterium]|nr:TlpA family protein disulfide reductase [Chloroflexota bacterium]